MDPSKSASSPPEGYPYEKTSMGQVPPAYYDNPQPGYPPQQQQVIHRKNTYDI